MSSKVTLRGFPFVTAAGIVAASALVASSPSLAQMPPAEGTTSIQRDSDQARALAEPSYQTREERLKAMPLDWNSTIGTPTPGTEERGALEGQSSEGGAPNPRAEEEARKLHPDDWK
jgi:hypothetical protein